MRLFLLLFIVIISFNAKNSHALEICKCIDPGTPRAALEKATGVFTGRVTNIRHGSESDRVYFNVDSAWKGPIHKEQKIYTQRTDVLGLIKNGFGCGFPFEEGQEYLVYTYHVKLSPQHTSRCMRTRPLAEAGEDLKALGAPEKIFKNEEAQW